MTKKTMKNKKKKRGFVSESFYEGLGYIRESKKFVYFACIAFLISALLGLLVPAPSSIEEIIRKFIDELIKATQGMSWRELFSFIFFNNLRSSFFAMIFGAGLGLFSVISILINGYLVGFVSSRAIDNGGIWILWRLFPHGVFELPAVLISMGLGIKLGTFILQKNKMNSLKIFFVKSIKTFLTIILPLLIVAALIETTLIVFFG